MSAYLKNYYSKNRDEYYIYFIGYSKYVKIGSSNEPRVRLSEFQIANPHKLEIFYAIKINGIYESRYVESEFQLLFKEYNIRGEWFYKKPVMDFIKKYHENENCKEYELPNYHVKRNEKTGGWQIIKKEQPK